MELGAAGAHQAFLQQHQKPEQRAVIDSPDFRDHARRMAEQLEQAVHVPYHGPRLLEGTIVFTRNHGTLMAPDAGKPIAAPTESGPRPGLLDRLYTNLSPAEVQPETGLAPTEIRQGPSTGFFHMLTGRPAPGRPT